MPSTSPAVSAPTSRATTTRCSVMNGGLPAALSSAADRGVATLGATRGASGVVAGAGAAGDGDLLQRQRAVVGAEELGDEVVDDPVAQRRIGAP